MTGRSEVSEDDRHLYSRVLTINYDELLEGALEDGAMVVRESPPPYDAGGELSDFVGNLDRIIRTLSTGSTATLDAKSKLAILNGIEEAARLAGQTLPEEFWDLRRAVNEGKA